MISILSNSSSDSLDLETKPTSFVRVLVAEPDVVSRRLVCTILEREPGVSFQCIENSDVVAALQDSAPDLVIVDSQASAIRRADNWEALGVTSPPATIVTSYDRTSLMPLASAAADLLIKPFDVEQFENAMQIARSKIAAVRARLNALRENDNSIHGMPHQPGFLQRFAAESEGRIVLVKARDILWLQSFGNHIRLHSAQATHLVRYTMKKLQVLLDPSHFLRVHRNAIVNLEHVVEFFLPATGNMFVKLDNGTCLPLRRANRASLRKLLRQHLLV